MVRPEKLVVPVANKVQDPHQAKSQHTLIARQRKRIQQKLQESKKRSKIAIYDHHNQS